jgi:hypothetical protein
LADIFKDNFVLVQSVLLAFYAAFFLRLCARALLPSLGKKMHLSGHHQNKLVYKMFGEAVDLTLFK